MRVHTEEQLLELLDEIVRRGARGDRTSRDAGPVWAELLTRNGHPLATRLPDENLLAWADRGLLGALDGACVLDVGCGNGRNSRWFAGQGARVLGIDISAELLELASPSLPETVTLKSLDILRDPPPLGPFDSVYDSGCFHHIPPHRRATYLRRVLPLIVDGGGFGIVAFASEAKELVSDADVLMTGDNAGGSSFALAELRQIFAPLVARELRRIRPATAESFGADFLDVGLFQAAGHSNREL